MSYQCVEIDKKIAHFKELARSVEDTRTVRSIDILIVEMVAARMRFIPSKAVSAPLLAGGWDRSTPQFGYYLPQFESSIELAFRASDRA